MGLDMWMYGIKDISNDEIPDNMSESWYEENGYKLILHYNDDNDFEQMFHDMYAYSTEKNVEYSETDFDKIKKVRGMDVIIVTTAKTDEEARYLLSCLGMPFRNK